MAKARKGRSGSRPDAPSGRRLVYEDLSFHAQQAAEKAINAVYVKLGMRFPYTHDIAELLSSLARSSVHLEDDVKAAADLSTYAWESRYPYFGDQVTEEEYREAFRQAETVIAWAEKQISSTQ